MMKVEVAMFGAIGLFAEFTVEGEKVELIAKMAVLAEVQDPMLLGVGIDFAHEEKVRKRGHLKVTCRVRSWR